MPSQKPDVSYNLRRALTTLEHMTGDGDDDAADRVMLGLAHQELEDLIKDYAEALAEITRMQRANLDLAALLRTQGCEIFKMRDRIATLEAENAALRERLNELEARSAL